jgi:hypothetical protein
MSKWPNGYNLKEQFVELGFTEEEAERLHDIELESKSCLPEKAAAALVGQKRFGCLYWREVNGAWVPQEEFQHYTAIEVLGRCSIGENGKKESWYDDIVVADSAGIRQVVQMVSFLSMEKAV